MDQEDKVRENRLRRIAERRGFRLEKSRRRDPHAIDFGGYMLVDVRKNFAVLGADNFAYSASLEDVENYLNEGHHTAVEAIGEVIDRPVDK
jgi:hypothetical protein